MRELQTDFTNNTVMNFSSFIPAAKQRNVLFSFLQVILVLFTYLQLILLYVFCTGKMSISSPLICFYVFSRYTLASFNKSYKLGKATSIKLKVILCLQQKYVNYSKVKYIVRFICSS